MSQEINVAGTATVINQRAPEKIWAETYVGDTWLNLEWICNQYFSFLSKQLPSSSSLQRLWLFTGVHSEFQ